jgi:hypothetical protein
MVVKSRATGEPGLGGTVNISELLINVVRFKRAGRRQLGLGPKWHGEGCSGSSSEHTNGNSPGGKAGPNPSSYSCGTR